MPTVNIPALTDEVLATARAFVTVNAPENGGDPELRRRLGPTFEYFTTHPVAPLNRRRLELLLERIHAVDSPRVLDLACGAGLITGAISRLGGKVLGLDISPSEIELARKFTAFGKYSAQFDTIDLMSDPNWYAQATAALGGAPHFVVMAYALHHLPGVERFVAELSAKLPPGTVVLVNEENPHSPLFRLKHLVRGFLQGDTEQEWHRTRGGWARLFRDAHFKDQARTRGVDPLPGLAALLPAACWSLVFEFERE